MIPSSTPCSTRPDARTAPTTWSLHLALFLSRCRQLRAVGIAFRTLDWHETELVFEEVAKRTVLKHLEKVQLSMTRLTGKALRRFLSNHKALHSVTFDSLDVTGDITFGAVLTELEENHDQLSFFACDQIAENGRRLYFNSLGYVECTDHTPLESLLLDREPSVLDDWATVTGPYRYRAGVHEWEGVQKRIGLLKEDLRRSRKSWEPDRHPWGMGYYWTWQREHDA